MSEDITSQPTTVLVTGAAGRLGHRVASLLHQSDYLVVATDLVNANDLPCRFQQADLLDHEIALELLQGIDVVMHIGNHPGIGAQAPQNVFNENVAMNENIFQGAAEQGVRRIIFSSTLQLIGSHIDDRTVINEPASPDYPMSGDTAPDPSNVYALSKTVSEVMLRYYANRCGIDCVALRFPLLHNNETRVGVGTGQETYTDLFEGFTGLTYDDAAALFLSTLRVDLPGYRVYMPATSHRHVDLALPDLIRQHYPGVSEATPDLVDFSRIVEETGWKPSSGYHPTKQTRTPTQVDRQPR